MAGLCHDAATASRPEAAEGTAVDEGVGMDKAVGLTTVPPASSIACSLETEEEGGEGEGGEEGVVRVAGMDLLPGCCPPATGR